MAHLCQLTMSHWLSYGLVLSFTCLSFYGLMSFGGASPDINLLSDSYFYELLGFTLKQSLLSALLSVAFAIPVARALFYCPKLPAKRWFLAFCLLCFVTPTLIVITGMVALLGRSGLLTPLLNQLTENGWNLYGLEGILLAHIFLNTPLAIRSIWLQLSAIPETSWRLAAQLKLSPWQRFKTVEWPVLRQSSAVISGFIFVLCFNSFAVVLALGGGPSSTTLEVAIYQALKYDFNIGEALTLAWSQLLIAGTLYAVMTRFGTLSWQSVDNGNPHSPPQPSRQKANIFKLIYLLSWALLLLPYIALLPGLLDYTPRWQDLSMITRPAVISLGLAFVAAMMAMGIAYLLLQPIRTAALQQKEQQQFWLETVATHTLITPAMVLSVGLFVFLLPKVDLDRYGIIAVVILNTLLLVPFAIQKLKPRVLQFDQQYDRLVRSLKLNNRHRWRLLWPFIKPVWLSTLGLVFVLGLGDVAIFSIFGNTEWTTLPWLIYGFAGSYQLAEASAASFLLLLICALILFLLERTQTRNTVRVEHS